MLELFFGGAYIRNYTVHCRCLCTPSAFNLTFPTQATPLHLACREGHLTVVDTLLTYEADVTKLDQNGSNALDLAIDHGHE